MRTLHHQESRAREAGECGDLNSTRFLSQGVESLLFEIRQSIAGYGPRCCLEMLDVCGIALEDSGAQQLFQEMKQLQVTVRRLMAPRSQRLKLRITLKEKKTHLFYLDFI